MVKRDDTAGGGSMAAQASSGWEDQEKLRLSELATELRSEILQRWRTYYEDRASGGVPILTLTPRQCGFSAIFRCDLSFPDANGRESLIIKIRRERRNGPFVRSELSDATMSLSRAEYKEHVRAHAFFAEDADGLSVVRPLDFIESFNALVVNHAVGMDLSKLVRAGSPIVPGAMRRCGAWWRQFHHDLHDSRGRAWNPETVDTAVDQRVLRLRGVGAPADVLMALREEICATARRVPSAQVPVSLVHGDCKLRHVWATAEGIQVLDFGNTKTGDSWMDPAALVVELSLYSLWSRRIDSGPQVPDIRTLVHSYFGGPPPPSFSLSVVDCFLKKWHRRLRSWGAGPGMTRLRRSLQTAGLDKPLERLYIDRWFTTQIRAWLSLAEGRPPEWLRTVAE
jgi:hypothetical protein